VVAYYMKVFNQRIQKSKRSQLRSDCSKAEQILWRYLSRSQLGVKFRRQHGIGVYIADFYCPEKKLVIEVDGDSHYQESGKLHDRIRDNFFVEQGLIILRFINN